MTRDEFDLLCALEKYEADDLRNLNHILDLPVERLAAAGRHIVEKGFADGSGITEKGREALEPYRVRNAVIAVPSISTDLFPMSLESPAACLRVNGEVLIERLIGQIQASGIKDIFLIKDHDDASIDYLADKYEGVKIFTNPEYTYKETPLSMPEVQEILGNSYIISGIEYFYSNPFERYVYTSFISESGDAADGITSMLRFQYWSQSLSKTMTYAFDLAFQKVPFEKEIWNSVVHDVVPYCHSIEIRKFTKREITDIDSLQKLRAMDPGFREASGSMIMKNITDYLKCRESDVTEFKLIEEGLTNISMIVTAAGEKYVYRHPGKGTEKLVAREHEKKSLELAKSIGVDPTYMFMDADEGWKISHFVADAREPDPSDFDDVKRIVSVLRKLHDSNIQADWEFDPWDEAGRLEDVLTKEYGWITDKDFHDMKSIAEKLYKSCKGDGVTKRFCHCDTYPPNWLFTDKGDSILIDWEYAGNADPGCDIGSFIVHVGWSVEEGLRFIREYLGDRYNDETAYHYLAYTVIMPYYWYMWTLYREACGEILDEYKTLLVHEAKIFAEYIDSKY